MTERPRGCLPFSLHPLRIRAAQRSPEQLADRGSAGSTAVECISQVLCVTGVRPQCRLVGSQQLQHQPNDKPTARRLGPGLVVPKAGLQKIVTKRRIQRDRPQTPHLATKCLNGLLFVAMLYVHNALSVACCPEQFDIIACG